MDKGRADRKRKISHDDEDHKDVDLGLSLGGSGAAIYSRSPPALPPLPRLVLPPPKPERSTLQLPFADPQFNPGRATFPTHPPPPPGATRRKSIRRPIVPSKVETVDPPFPWATDRQATVHSLRYLLSHGITVVEGESQCRRCETRTVVPYQIIPKFEQVLGFVQRRHQSMYDRAPQEWASPQYPACGACGQANVVRPVIANDRDKINWLFMFLGQTIGQCTLEQLRYFCEHTGNHRTGAKDRLLYLTYFTIFKQLDPDGSFSREMGRAAHRSQPRLLGGIDLIV